MPFDKPRALAVTLHRLARLIFSFYRDVVDRHLLLLFLLVRVLLAAYSIK